MGCRRKNTLCLSLDFGANDGTLLPRLTRLETSPSPQKRLVLKFYNMTKGGGGGGVKILKLEV